MVLFSLGTGINDAMGVTNNSGRDELGVTQTVDRNSKIRTDIQTIISRQGQPSLAMRLQLLPRYILEKVE